MSKHSGEAIIQEAEFTSILSSQAEGFIRYLNLLGRRDTRDWVKRHYNELMVRAHELETLLDDYGARNNKNFCFLGEMVASLRGFGRIGSVIKHLAGRFPRYQLVLDEELTREFFAEADRTVRFLNQAILALRNAVLAEFRRLGVKISADAQADSSVGEVWVREWLPHNIDEADAQDEETRIAEVASKYLKAEDVLGGLNIERIEDPRALRTFVLENFDEERSRSVEALVHSIQSKYDTYVKSTPLESRTPALPRMRGHASATLHLLEMATELIHFYVRHENDVRSEEVRARMSNLINKNEVLDRAANFAVRFATRFIRAGRPFADEALSAFVQQQELRVTIPEGKTLHARPISLVVKIVNRYETRVELEIEGEACSGSSIMEIIMIVGNKPNARELIFRGDCRPLADLALLFENGLGEGGLDKLPDQLGYLRA